MPELLRVLYGCGLRLEEALSLRIRDVDLIQGVLHINDTKFRKDRLVPPARPLVVRLQKYAATLGPRPADAHFFPSPRGGPLHGSGVYRNYRDLLQLSLIHISLRLFLQFLFMRDILPRDLSTAIPRVRLASNAKVPSVWEPELVERLLAVVDRSSPKGRRDYAILLLAARLGLRLGDIKGLTLDHLHWTTSTIEIVQNKTGEPLVLPLIEEVGTAIIDYLRAGLSLIHI